MSDPWQEVYEIGYSNAVRDCIAIIEASVRDDMMTSLNNLLNS